jgi:hypothetical protein
MVPGMKVSRIVTVSPRACAGRGAIANEQTTAVKAAATSIFPRIEVLTAE